MRTAALGGAAALLISLGVAPAASADPATETYQGTWSSAAFCGYDGPVTGNWTVVTKQDGSAEVRLVIFTGQGQLHAAWGGAAVGARFTQTDPGTDVFDVTSGRFTFVLDQAGHLTYTVDPYICSGTPTVAHVDGELTR